MKPIADTLENLVTNVGTTADKSTFSTFIRKSISEEQLLALYCYGGIGGKIVDVVADDSTSQWRSVTIPQPLDRAGFDKLETALKVRSVFCQADRWARLFGGSVIFIDIEGDDPAEPLLEETVNPSKPVTGLQVRSRYDLGSEALDKRTMRPIQYRDVHVDNSLIYHPSRVLGPFDGLELPRREMERNQGWGGSILWRCFDALLNDATVTAQAAPLLHEALVRTVGVKDLARYLKNSEAQRVLEKRFALAKFLAASANVYIYDPDEETSVDRSSVTAVAGLADLFEKFANRIAAEVDIPMTRLYGQVTGGLNTSASTNLKDYYKMIASHQTAKFDEHLAKLDRLLLRSVYGQVPADYWTEWNALDEPSEDEKAKTDKTKGDTDNTLIQAGVIVAAQAARRIQKDGPYTLSDEFVEALEERDGLKTPANQPVESAPTPGVGGDLQKQALNGAQMSALIEIAARVRIGELGASQAQAILLLAVPEMSAAQAQSIAGVEGVVKPTAPQPMPQSATPQPVDLDADQ